MAAHPNKAPQLKVKPNTNCGQYVIRFIRGYNVTSTETNNNNRLLFRENYQNYIKNNLITIVLIRIENIVVENYCLIYHEFLQFIPQINYF